MQNDPMDMFDEMDAMFDRIFSRMDREFTAGSPGRYGYRIVIDRNGSNAVTEIPPAPIRAAGEPVAEVHHVGDETMVITELPGAPDDSIRLDVRGSTLVIDAGDAENHYHTTAEVPGVDPASLQRSFRHGVLEVTFRNQAGSSGTDGAGTP